MQIISKYNFLVILYLFKEYFHNLRFSMPRPSQTLCIFMWLVCCVCLSSTISTCGFSLKGFCCCGKVSPLQLEGTNKRQTRVRARPLYTDTSMADLIRTLGQLQERSASFK